MAKPGQRAEVNTFIQGLITEASPLNFPPNASKLEENFELSRDGTRRRRKGMDYETGYALRSTPSWGTIHTTDPGYNAVVWEGVMGDSTKDYLAVQIGDTIDFYDLSPGPITDVLLGSVTLAVSRTNRFSMASIDGYLVIATGGVFTYYITQNDAGTISAVPYTLKVRDFWGVDSGNPSFENDIYFRPSTMPPLVAYNLYNQSWGIPRKDAAGNLSDPTGTFHGEYNKYPSNSEVVWSALQFQAVTATQTPYERIYVNMYDEVFGLAPLASRGYFIIDALDRGASRVAAYNANDSRFPDLNVPIPLDPPEDRTPGSASVVAKYAGRIFYAGFEGKVIDGDSRSPSLNNYVLFSKLVDQVGDLGKCYQEGDPTSREGADVVDTDGGYIKITEATKIVSLRVMGNDLIVLAENGIWAITGGSDFGFTATNYKVTKLSTFGSLSDSSVVEQGDSVVYWSESGIYQITRNNLGAIGVQSMSKTTIQKFYDSIPIESRSKACGAYDDADKKIRWLFRENTIFTLEAKTTELVLDFDLGNFTINTINNLGSSVAPILPVFYKDEPFYITMSKGGGTFYNYTVAKYNNLEFKDWKTVDGVGMDAKAFVWTGDQIVGDSAVYKQVPYIVIHLERTETGTDEEGKLINQSSCLFRVFWDWSNSELSNKVAQFQQAYRYRKPLFSTPSSTYDNGFSQITTKNKVRGRGRAVALYFETEPEKDCHLLGWNVTFNGNSIA